MKYQNSWDSATDQLRRPIVKYHNPREEDLQIGQNHPLNYVGRKPPSPIKARSSEFSVLCLAPSGNFDAPYFHRANAFISALSTDPLSQIIEIGPPRRLRDLFHPVTRLRNPDRIKVVSLFWVNIPEIARIDTFVFAMVRAIFLNVWAGSIARLFLRGRRFKSLLFYSPQFAFFRLFLRPRRDTVTIYDKADAYSLFYKGAVRKAIAFLDEYNTTHADIVFSPSPQLEALARRQGAKRTSRVDNGIYSHNFSPGSKRDKMLAVYVGNLVHDMWGVDLFLEAIPHVVRDFPDFHAAVIGEGPLKAEYELLCNRLGITNHTKFEGFVPHEKIGHVICTARVAVAPYKRFEGFGFASRSLKISEYLASGTPVVVTNVGSFADLIEKTRLGFVVEPTSEKIAEGITSVLRLTDDEWEAMSQRAASTAQEYDWDTILSKAFDEIEKIRVQISSAHGQSREIGNNEPRIEG